MHKTKENLSAFAGEFLEGVYSSGHLPNSIIVECDDEEYAVSVILKALASLECSSDGEPCGKCVTCNKILSDNCQDIIHYYPEKQKISIGVDQAREIKNFSVILPADLDNRVYFIHSCDRVSSEVQNALLKTLEEPKAFNHYVFLCSSASSFLPTVISRCRIVKFGIDGKTNAPFDKKILSKATESFTCLFENSKADFVNSFPGFEKDRQQYIDYLKCMLLVISDLEKMKNDSFDNLRILEEDNPLSSYLDNITETQLSNIYRVVFGILNENTVNLYIPLSRIRLISFMWNIFHK